MADNLTTMLVRLGLTPLMWVLRLLIIITGKYLANLITLFFYLEHVLDNLNKFKILPNNRKSKDNSKEKALKLLNRKIKFHKCLKIIVQYHRNKHLKLRNKFKFNPTLPTIDEADEIDQTPCNNPFLPSSTQPPYNIPSPAPTTKNSAISIPRAIQPITLDQNFPNHSFLIPDFIVPSDSIPSNFNTNFAAQFNHYVQQKNSRKPFRYIERKFKFLKKNLFKKK
ncbi:hypothetical protein TNIN_208641 [Trichonephila inaurata madagascariensis]|uniref:Uncharacterized protein n=1 Tax=Trichonephila inaurata madagascariensis TaxID=2747483 RepID=A0A8X7C584_9ARAC|nr:hypothetical protein TNIN_208641 [Trichonephila inaurata madagascariensis]